MYDLILNHSNRKLVIVLGILVSLFCLSLFKNIQYPLLWNDEADTAVYATRILKFGYPKVHDGKNIPIQIPNHNPSLVIEQKTDAFLESDWLQYYFSAFFLFFANLTNNIYITTAILRLPFALAGTLGLTILVLSVLPALNSKKQKLIFLVLFTLFELLSIPLVLHLREMRYYPLLLLLVSSLFFLIFKFHIFHTINYRLYCLLLIIAAILILNTFHPAFFPIFFFLGLLQVIPIFSADKKFFSYINLYSIKRVFRSLMPIFIIIIVALPYFFFFKTFSIAIELSKSLNFDPARYIGHISGLIAFFWHNELLLTALFLKLGLFAFDVYSKKIKNIELLQKIQISNLFTVFFIIYALFISRIPYFLFTRYFIILQPILTIITLLDTFILFNILSAKYRNKLVFVPLLGFLFIYNLFIFYGTAKFDHITGHIYELTHRYEGPLDYIIPYIRNNYAKPENLIISTNYEELSLMFYLDSKIIIGSSGNNLLNDLQIQPDIIIYRKDWENMGWLRYSRIFDYYLSKKKYQLVSFPIFDYPVNNIPEFDFIFPHLFQKKTTANPEQQLTIYVREDLPASYN